MLREWNIGHFSSIAVSGVRSIRKSPPCRCATRTGYPAAVKWTNLDLLNISDGVAITDTLLWESNEGTLVITLVFQLGRLWKLNLEVRRLVTVCG